MRGRNRRTSSAQPRASERSTHFKSSRSDQSAGFFEVRVASRAISFPPEVEVHTATVVPSPKYSDLLAGSAVEAAWTTTCWWKRPGEPTKEGRFPNSSRKSHSRITFPQGASRYGPRMFGPHDG